MALIRLQVPGSLEYRDLAIRVVAAACKLVSGWKSGSEEVRADFDNQVISSFGEAFNNAAIHSYKGRTPGNIELELEVEASSITIRICDYGNTFDWSLVKEPDLDELPESGLGLFIMRSFMDSVSYQAGAPNVLSMTKHLATPTGDADIVADGGAR